MLLRISQAAERIGVHPDTLKTWSQEDRGPQFTRTAGNHRRYDSDVLDQWNYVQRGFQIQDEVDHWRTHAPGTGA